MAPPAVNQSWSLPLIRPSSLSRVPVSPIWSEMVTSWASLPRALPVQYVSVAPENGSAEFATSFTYPRRRAVSRALLRGSWGRAGAAFMLVLKEAPSRTFIWPRGET